jgi:hypothetical protein
MLHIGFIHCRQWQVSKLGRHTEMLTLVYSTYHDSHVISLGAVILFTMDLPYHHLLYAQSLPF